MVIRAVRNTINLFAEKPTMLFLIDGLGAMLTASSLFVLSTHYNEYFGMPRIVMTCLSMIAAIFCIYSTSCFLFLKDNWTPFIRAIIIANLLYCVLTIGLIFFYFPMLTILGITYFFGEIAIICGLVYIEFKSAAVIRKS